MFHLHCCFNLIYLLNPVFDILSSMSNDATPVSSWATGTNESWRHLKKGFKHLSVEYAALGDRASQEVRIESKLCLFTSRVCFRMHRSVAGHNPYNLFMLTIYRSKNFTTETMKLLIIEHTAIFVVKV